MRDVDDELLHTLLGHVPELAPRLVPLAGAHEDALGLDAVLLELADLLATAVAEGGPGDRAARVCDAVEECAAREGDDLEATAAVSWFFLDRLDPDVLAAAAGFLGPTTCLAVLFGEDDPEDR